MVQIQWNDIVLCFWLRAELLNVYNWERLFRVDSELSAVHVHMPVVHDLVGIGMHIGYVH